ncbi:MAG: IS200/IS605 family transposase [Nitrospinae bacterium]|nr:IS200/IS605 family transposase [Nitrospinota bacterium]
MKNEVEKRVKELFEEIAQQYEFEIDTMELMPDHVYIFLSAPPKCSPARIVHTMKGISPRKIFKEYPWLKKHLWGGGFWSDGYFVRTVGDKVTADVIRRYIKYQHQIEHRQLKLF